MFETFARPTRHVARTTTHGVVHFRAFAVLAHQARGLASIFGVVVVLFKTAFAKIMRTEETRYIDNDVKMAYTFMVYEIQVQ